MPRGWTVEGSYLPAGGGELPNAINLKSPNSAIATIAVEEKESVSPRTVRSSLSPRVKTARNLGAHVPLLLLAPWLSERTRALLEDEEINYIDMTGNALLRLDNPPFFLQATGAARNPWPKERGRAQLRGAKAARLIRLLLDIRPPYGVQEIAEATGLAPGYVSRLLDTLYREALIERAPRGPVESVDVAALLRRWAGSYDVFQSNDAKKFIAPSGVDLLLLRLADNPELGTRNPITGSFAASRLAPVASPALLLLYTLGPELPTRDLELLPADEGANVMLLQPSDSIAVERSRVENGLRYAAPSQVAVDCLTGNGRMPAEGEALIEWMLANETAWRRGSLQELNSREAS